MAAGALEKVRNKVGKAKAYRLAVFRESVQRLAEIAQTPVGQGGNMPVRTGFLRASFIARLGLSVPTKTVRPKGGAQYAYSSGPIALVIAQASIDSVVTLAWTASYARSIEHRRAFARLAAQQWRSIVRETEVKAKARAGK